MSSFLLPNSFCSELDRIFKNFWWGFLAKKARNLSLKAWDSLCIPKALGGLGLRKAREVNLALISKLGWKLLNISNSVWVTQLHYKYLNSSSFVSPNTLSSFSWLWKGIQKTLSFITKGACNRILSSSSLLIWISTWIPSLSSFSPTPSPQLTQPFPNLLVSDLFLTDPYLLAPVWNVPLLQHLFDSVTIREILKINFATTSEDKYIWTPSTNGLFSTKSIHKLISSQRISLATGPLSTTNRKLLWKLNLNDMLKLLGHCPH